MQGDDSDTESGFESYSYPPPAQASTTYAGRACKHCRKLQQKLSEYHDDIKKLEQQIEGLKKELRAAQNTDLAYTNLLQDNERLRQELKKMNRGTGHEVDRGYLETNDTTEDTLEVLRVTGRTMQQTGSKLSDVHTRRTRHSPDCESTSSDSGFLGGTTESEVPFELISSLSRKTQLSEPPRLVPSSRQRLWRPILEPRDWYPRTQKTAEQSGATAQLQPSLPVRYNVYKESNRVSSAGRSEECSADSDDDVTGDRGVGMDSGNAQCGGMKEWTRAIFQSLPDVYKQKQFTYTGKEDHLLWEEYGIKLHFPSHTSDVHIEGTVSVLSTDSDNYIFPEGSELVSAVYDISAGSPFPAPVTVQIQHCVPLYNEKEASCLGLVIANAEEGPPYVFEELTGAEFRCGSQYGQIQLTHFSKFAEVIKWSIGRPIPFCASVYYLQNCRACFVVTKNLAAHITAIKENYGHVLNVEFPVKIDRYSPAVGLEFPSDSDWKVIPLVTPALIDMDVVLQYQPGKVIPQIPLRMKWAGQGQQVEDEVQVKLTRVHGEKSFLLLCSPTTATKVPDLSSWRNKKPDMQRITLIKYRAQNEEREFRLLQKIQCKWHNIGLLLNVAVNTIERCKTDEEKCKDVLRMWLENGSLQYPVEWFSLIRVLQDMEMRTVAEDLGEALDKCIV